MLITWSHRIDPYILLSLRMRVFRAKLDALMKSYKPAIAPRETMKHVAFPMHIQATTREIQLFGILMGIQAQREMQKRSNEKHYGLKDDGDDWYTVSARYLKKVFGSDYPRVIESLIYKGLLIRLPGYVTAALAEETGKEPRCKAFKIPDEIMGSPMGIVEVPFRNKEFSERVEYDTNENGEPIFEEALISPEEKARHKEKLSHVSLAVGHRDALNEEFNARFSEAQGISDETKRQKAFASANSFYSVAEVCINAVQHKDSWVTKCIGNRIHTAITNMPSIIRQYILLDGEKTTELDAANSQPSMFGGILREFQELAQTPEGIREIAEKLREWDAQPRKAATKAREILSDKEYKRRKAETGYRQFHDEYGNMIDEDKTPEYRAFVKAYTCDKNYNYNLKKRAGEVAELVQSSSEEIDTFVGQVGSGVFYAVIQKATGIPDKKQAKGGVMKVLFESLKKRDSDHRAEKKARKEVATGEEKQTALKVRAAMRDLYPSLYRLIEVIKEETYAGFAISLQRKESEVMICEELTSIMSVFVHDAIIVKTSEWEQSKIAFEERLKACRIHAKVNVKHNEPKQYREAVLKRNEDIFKVDTESVTESETFPKNASSNLATSTELLASSWKKMESSASKSGLPDTQASPLGIGSRFGTADTPLNVSMKNITKYAISRKATTWTTLTHASGAKDFRTCHIPSSEVSHGTEARPPPWENET
jgi:hypothetical protein